MGGKHWYSAQHAGCCFSVSSAAIQTLMKKISFVFLSGLISVIAIGQQFGGNPASLKWKQISTDTARIIFPAGMESQANRAATIIHRLAADNMNPLGNRLQKIDIVLQNQTTVPNGYVNLGPYRSEFYMTPAFNNLDQGSIPWADQLALHEYRHVQQYNNFKQGASKLMGILFGEDGFALASNAAVPDWFFEGDAVYQETVLSEQGRGRLPQFLNAYPSMWLKGKGYKWMKLRNGSLKHYVPNHYYLGYLLVNYGYSKYGNDFWKKVTGDAAAFKGLFYPFQHAIKKHAGVDYKKFVADAFEFYKSELRTNLMAEENRINYLQKSARDTIDDMSVKGLTREAQMNGASQQKLNQGGDAGIKNLSRIKKNFLTNYYFPYAIGIDSLVYLKTSGRQLPAFYIRDNSGEKKLKLRDISIDEQFSYRNGKIVYSAYETDSRWSWKDYSVVKLLDIKTGEQKNITHSSKYFTPDISADGKRIVAVFYDTNGKNELHILNADDGTVIQIIKSIDIGLFTDPKFADDNTLATSVRLPDGKMCLAVANIETGSVERLSHLSFNVIGYPQVKDGMVYFTASYIGNNDIYALRLSDKKTFKVNRTPAGSYFPHVNDGKLYYSEFTANGYQLMQADMPAVLQELSETDIKYLRSRFKPGSGFDILNTTASRNFEVSNYRKGTRLFNFHSWRPYYSDPLLSFSLYGENVLNTLQTEIYYQYNENEKEHSVGAAAVYGAWFPYVNIGTQYTFNRVATINNLSKEWNQLDSYIGLSVPLNKVSGKTVKSFNIGSNYVLRNEMVIGPSKLNFSNENFSYLSHFINFSQRMQRATQHIYSPFSYSLSLNHRHAITEYTGYQFLGNGSITIPGFHSTHNFVLTGSFQQRDTVNPQLFSDRLPYSRGYEGRYFSRMWRLSGNYHFPILYPDWGFANMLYITRIRGNAFYDYTKVYSRDKTITADQRSTGIEVYFDTKWWNQYPLTFGFRISRLLDPDQFDGFKGNVFEVILPVSIFPR
jgi:hypothetical protein